MRVDRCGESLFIVREVAGQPAHLARWIAQQNLPGVLEVVSAYETVGVHCVAGGISRDQIESAILRFVPTVTVEGEFHRIPVCYELGLDLDACCEALTLSHEQLIEQHTAAEYVCEAVGFSPGFPYLSGLPERLSGLPRMKEPRLRVPLGSIGITGAQCGIYPDEVPGGWNLIGRTPLIVCDPNAGFFPIQAGDRIQFDPMSREAFESWQGVRVGVQP